MLCKRRCRNERNENRLNGAKKRSSVADVSEKRLVTVPDQHLIVAFIYFQQFMVTLKETINENTPQVQVIFKCSEKFCFLI